MSSVKESQTLKQLQTRKAKLEADKQAHLKDFQEAKKIYESTLDKIKKVQLEIDSMQQKELTVSEHAMLKYLERIYGIDLEELRGLILTDSLRTMVKTLGDGKYPLEGAKAVVKGNNVVTIIES